MDDAAAKKMTEDLRKQLADLDRTVKAIVVALEELLPEFRAKFASVRKAM